MAMPIAMPRQGQSVEVCTILSWLKHTGDTVKKGDLLFSYETDKASFEFESPADGTLLSTFFDEGAEVPVLTNVAVLGMTGENFSQFKPAVTAGGGSSAEKPIESQSVTQPPVSSSATPMQTAVIDNQSGNKKISPRARSYAAEHGVDLDALTATGSGAGGRIIESDVKNAPRLSKTAIALKTAQGNLAATTASGLGGRVLAGDLSVRAAQTSPAGEWSDTITDVKLSTMRKIIAQRMTESLHNAAQLSMTTWANATMLIDLRKQIKKSGHLYGLSDITVTDLIIYAVSRTLVQYPDMNAILTNDTIRQYADAHVALAIDTPRGLMVPVIRFANRMSISEISRTVKSLAQACNNGSINPDLLNGGTLTISNLGTFGIESFTPVLNYPQVGILGVNTIAPRPIAGENGGHVFAPHIGLSLTIDHRAIDGAPAARFLQAVVQAIEGIGVILTAGK